MNLTNDELHALFKMEEARQPECGCPTDVMRALVQLILLRSSARAVLDTLPSCGCHPEVYGPAQSLREVLGS